MTSGAPSSGEHARKEHPLKHKRLDKISETKEDEKCIDAH
jgi:hypothetical protein